MLLVLLNLGAGREPNDHLSGRSHFGGYNGTRAALISRGWVDPYTMALTDAGRHAAGLDEAQEDFECFRCIGCGARSPAAGNWHEADVGAFWAGWLLGLDGSGAAHYACRRCCSWAIHDGLPTWPLTWRGAQPPLPDGGREQLLAEFRSGELFT